MAEVEQIPSDVAEHHSSRTKRFDVKKLLNRGNTESDDSRAAQNIGFNAPDTKISRRALIKGAFAAGGLAALAKGIEPTSVKDSVEYILDSGPIRILFGNHHIPPRSDQVSDDFQTTGDLQLSQWDESTNRMIDQSMKGARQNGKPYFVMVDSQSASVTQNLMIGGAGVNQESPAYKASEFSDVPPDWLFLPHPDLTKQDQYPSKIYLIEGDVRSDFGFGNIPNSENYLFLLEGLEQFLQNRYSQKSRPEIVAEVKNETVNALRDKLTEGTIAAAALAAGLPPTETTRRRILKVAGLISGVGIAEASKGLLQGNAMSLLIGKIPDPVDQRILTSLSDTVNWTYADKPSILWANARTALAIEKAQAISENPDPSLSESQIQIDLLYGSGHSAEVTRIMKDQSFRHQQIAAFINDVLLQIDVYINGFEGSGDNFQVKTNINGHERIKTIHANTFEQLKAIRNDLFKVAANSMLSYKINEIHMPWGVEKIRPEDIANFNANLTTNIVSGETQSLKPVINDVLNGFGIVD